MSFERCAKERETWVEGVCGKLRQKMPYAVEKARALPAIPYSALGSDWQGPPIDGICCWTGGFWPGAMWQMYLLTGEKLYFEEARRVEAMLDDAFRAFDDLHHDLGFMWRLSSGVDFDLTGDDASRKRTLLAANLLAGRFNPLGFIRAWNKDYLGWAIVDCMMNLNLLYWAWEHTGDPRFRKIAMIHADTTMEHFVRPDGSCNHIVKFDPETMEVLEAPAGQGYAAGSSWSRGQAWALYGFVLSYIHTGKQEYLDTAKRVAHYFLSCIGEDGIPDVDFRAPKTPVLKDNIAGAIAACGLLEIARHSPEMEERLYFDGAMKLLCSMEEADADWSLHCPAIFRRCTGAYHAAESHHMSIQYCEYFFLEAVNKLRGEKLLFW